MSEIGRFQYHIFCVVFTCDEEAGMARVLYTESGEVIEDRTHSYERHGGNFIGAARTHFENCVGRSVGYTSRSMVEQFVQLGR
jgi:hypothetical protein